MSEARLVDDGIAAVESGTGLPDDAAEADARAPGSAPGKGTVSGGGAAAFARRVAHRYGWHAVTAACATAMFLVGLGGSPRRIAGPLGIGDLLFSYVFAKMWRDGTPFGNSTLGFPFGIELRYFPTTDILTNAVAGLLSGLADNPFVGLNAVFALSFPATALVALWVLGLAGLRGPVAVAMALAFTVIPFHWFRIEHVYLATMYSAALGVGLALLIGSGRIESRLRSTRRWREGAMLLVIAAIIATSGVYYACFTILLGGAAVLYRFAHGARWRGIALSLTPIVAVGVLTAMALAPAWLYERSHPTAGAVAGRFAWESVAYSGTLAFTLLPAPVSQVPGMGPVNEAVTAAFVEGNAVPSAGVLWYGNFGSLSTVLAIVLTVVGVVLTIRRSSLAVGRARAVPDEQAAPRAVTFGLVGFLLATVLLFFVPWGLNFLFAFALTPQLRAWDRLTPVLFLLVFTGAALAWTSLGLPSKGRRAIAFALACGVLLVFDSVLPYRALFDNAAAKGGHESGAGYAYATALNAAVPGECGVLELPYMAFPETPSVDELPAYAPLWPALTNPEKRWSFGAMKQSRADIWLEDLSNDLDATDVEHLSAGGFCAVHLDLRGFPADQDQVVVDDLTELLGPPVASGHGADWLAFALPDDTPASPDAADAFENLPADVQLFYAPPTLTLSSPGLPTDPERGDGHEWWWLPTAETTFEIRATDAEAGFAEVTGQLRAAECAPRTVRLTLVSGDEAVSDSIELTPGELTDFALRLPQDSTGAQLRVSSDGEGCLTTTDPRSRAVALVDVAVGD